MRWPPYDHIFFDCDSTLTTIEGIDVLADMAKKKWRVEVLTNAAMNGDLDLGEVYDKRLKAVKPSKKQVQAIRAAYKRHIVEDAAEIIRLLQENGHHVYIISGGLAEPVEEFGIYLGVPRDHIRAVDVQYNELSGNWWQGKPGEERYLAYEAGALTVSDGKAEVVRELLAGKNGRSLLIGDGSSDLLASRAVDLFVGFGGVVARQRVQAEAPVFINTPSIAPLLAIAMGPAQLHSLGNPQLEQKIVQQIETGALTFQNEQLETKFQRAFRARPT